MTRIEIAGQQFDVLDSIGMEQDLYLSGLIERGGLTRLPFRRDESPEQAFERLIGLVQQSRVLRNVLSILIVPAGESWTLEGSYRTAAFLKRAIDLAGDHSLAAMAHVVGRALMEHGVLRYEGDQDGPGMKPKGARR